MSKSFDIILKSQELKDLMDYSRWIEEIPYIQFPKGWKVKIIPPFTGAMVRFKISKGQKDVSVYLDCHNVLGLYQGPYWEVDGWDNRCAMEDVEGLIKIITKLLK